MRIGAGLTAFSREKKMTDDTNATEPSALRAKLEAEIARNKELSDKFNELVAANRKNTVESTLSELKVPKEAAALVPDTILDADGVKSWVESHKAVLKFQEDAPAAPVDQATSATPPVAAQPAATVTPEFVAAQQRAQQVATGAATAPPKDLGDRIKALMNDESFLNDPSKSVDQIFAELKAAAQQTSA